MVPVSIYNPLSLELAHPARSFTLSLAPLPTSSGQVRVHPIQGYISDFVCEGLRPSTHSDP